MQRGILKLTGPQIDLSLQLLASSPQKVQFLSERLTHAKAHSDANPSIELSEDEVDILLDVLPAPAPDENKSLTNLRINLQHFLMDLRDQTPKAKPSLLSKLNPANWGK